MPRPIKIIMDDREKKRTYDQEYLGNEFSVERKRLQTGDYTIKSLKDRVCIEKKSGWEEIVGNLKTKANRERFKDELRRMETFSVRLLVVHSDLSKIPLTDLRFAKGFKYSSLEDWVINTVLEHNVQILPVGHYETARPMIRKLFKDIMLHHKEGRLYGLG